MDWVSVAEAAYRLERTDDAWLEAVLTEIAEIDHGLGVVAQVFRETTEGSELVRVATFGGPPDLADHVARITTKMPPQFVSQMRAVGRMRSMRTAMRTFGGEELFVQALASLPGPHADVHFVAIRDGEDHTLAISGGRRTVGEPMPHAGRLRRVAAHIGAGFRLRRRLTTQPSTAEAVLRLDGKLEDGSPEAIDAREVLADAVIRSERARGRARRRPDEALSLWQGLVAGRWSLVDRIERDGKRLIVAHQNAPHIADPRGLTQREAAIAQALGDGSTLKEIAYDVGVSVSAITKAATRARTKLGLRTLGELAAFFAPATRLRAHELDVAGERFLVTPIAPSEAALEILSPAEREIAERVIRGDSNRQIADSRGTSPRTVANQLQRIFHKLGVGSRTELARRLTA
ncbi:MAG: LuxR C-terminal-related transcriptional regulator [Sandaracinaceae bacterium]